MKPNVWTLRSKCLVGLLVGMAALHAIAVDSRAQEVKVRLESVGGPFSLYAVEDTWVERVATVVNDSDSPRQLRVAYLAPTRGKQMRYTRMCDVPPHTDRRMEFGAYLRDLKPSGRPFGPEKYDEITDIFLLSDAKTDQELMRIPESRGRIPSQTLAICRIGGSIEDSGGIPEVRKLISNSFREYQAVQSMTMGQLPDCWYGYSMGGMLLLGESQLGTLRLSQRQALLEYVRRGAVMLVLGTEKMGEMLRGDLADAAGVSVLGYHKTQSIQLPTPAGTEARKYAVPQTFVELCPDGAEVLLQSDGLPLLTKHALGRGYVFVLTVPLMAVNEATLRPVEQTRSLQPPVKEDEFARSGTAGTAVLNQIAGRPGPVRAVPVAILLGLAALVLVGGLVAKFRGRGERVWAVLAPLAILVAVGIYAQTAWHARDVNPRLSTVGMVSGIGDGLARVEQVFAYGAPNREVDTFSTDTFSGTLADIGEAGGLGAELETRSGSVMSMPNQAVDPDSTRAFRVEEVLPTGDVASRLTFGPKGLTGSIQNGLRLDLQDAVLYVNHHAFAVGAVPAGQKLAVEGVSQLADGEFTTGVLHDVLRNTLLQRLAARPSINPPVSPQPLLIGKLDGGLLTPLDKPGLTKTGWSLAIWPVTIVPPEPLSPVRVPPGFVQTQIRLGDRWGVMTDPHADSRTTAIGLRGVLPPQVRGLTDVKATLRLRLQAGNYRMALLGMGPGGRGEALHSVEGPRGMVDVTVPKAERFWSADGACEFSLKMELMGKSGEESISQWTLESADITLEGIAK